MFKKRKTKERRVKELVINSVLYSMYETDGEMLYLKIYNNINPELMDDSENEGVLISLINIIENKEFKYIGFLNI